MARNSREKPTRKRDASVLFFNPRLRKKFAAIFTRPMTVFEAPMGYGKTVAVHEFLRESGLLTIWTAALDAGPDIFWRDLCRNLRRAIPDKEGPISALERLGYPHDAARTGEACHLFLDLGLAGETALIVDDFHLLPVHKGTARAGIGGLFELLAARDGEETPRMILVSRNTYTGNRDILLLKKLLTTIDAGSLALRETDIREYYRRCGVSVSSDEAHTLFRRTSGWISALYLNLLHLHRLGADAVPEALDRLVDREVLDAMPKEALDLLLTTFPMERFTRVQAESVHGGGKVSALLETLLKVNSFLDHNAVDGTYTLHTVVRGRLAERFAALPENRRRAIWFACGESASADGDILTALRHFGEAHAHERALEVMESDAGKRLVTKDIEVFRRLFDSCPADMLARHVSAEFQYALCAFIGGHAELFGQRLARLEKLCVTMPGNDPMADSWRSDLEFLLSLAAYNDIAAMSRHHRRALALRRNGSTSLFSHQAPWTLGSPSVLFMFHRESGGLDKEIALMHECMPHYYRLASGHGSGAEYQMEAEALFQRGDFSGAAVCGERAAAAARAGGQMGIVLAALFLRQRLRLLEGDYVSAKSLLDEMRASIRARSDYFYLHTVELCEGCLLTALGRTESVAAWLKQGVGGEGRLYNFAGGYYYIAHGGILLAEERWAEAIGLYSWLLDSGLFSRNLLLIIHAHIFLAAANQELGHSDLAERELRRAGDLAFPDLILMPFVESWRFLSGISVGRGKAAADAFDRIHELAAQWEPRRREILARDFPPERPILTEREWEMARMATAGMRYHEIAATVHLAHGTVKRAFATIYAKLDISSRGELRMFVERHCRTSTKNYTQKTHPK